MFKRSPLFAFILLISLALGYFIFSPNRFSNTASRDALRNQLKKEIYEQLDSDIKQMVKREVETYLASHKDIIKEGDLQEISLGPNKKEAIRNMIDEILKERPGELTNQQLDQIVASGEEQEVILPGGYRGKIPAAYQLAKAEGDSEAAHGHGASATTSGEESETVAGEQKTESLERALVQKGGILLPKRRLQIEPSISYAHFSSNRITIYGFNILPVLVIGNIATQTLKRDIIIETLSMKYGIFNNFQGDLKVPYRAQFDRTNDTVGTETANSGGGMGDIEFGLSRQIARDKGFIPDTIASFSVKSNTGKTPYGRDIGIGTGHWAYRGGLTFVKSSDPAVVYGGVNYTHSIPRVIEGFGRLAPGDTYGYSVGTAIALSYQTAINFGFDQSVTMSLERDHQIVGGSFLNAASFKTGFTWAINEKQSIDCGIGFGLTSDAPDFSVELRFPRTF